MKISKYFLTALFLISISSSLYAQTFKVPVNYSFEKATDYKKYNNDIIKCANWLEKTGPDETNKNFNEAKNFLAEWVSGCPYVNFSRNVRIDLIFTDNPELKTFYMGGWARNVLEKEEKVNTVDNCVAGLISVLKVYKAKKNIKRNKTLDELVVFEKQGKLREWVMDRQ